jgi:hypothetical protein
MNYFCQNMLQVVYTFCYLQEVNIVNTQREGVHLSVCIDFDSNAKA